MSKPVQVEVVLSHSEYLPVVDVWLVVDTLRASTVIVRWFELGGRELFPTATIEEAIALSERLGREGTAPLLMGERNAIAPQGFDMGNSPLDITEITTQGYSSAVMATTNGTRALLKASRTGIPVLVACARNAFAVLDAALAKGRRIGIFCAGRKGRPAWDDTLCAGLLIALLTERFPDTRLADSARLALVTWRSSADFTASLNSADHAVFLNKIGYGDDVAFAGEIGVTRSVPELHELPDGDGMLAVLREGWSDAVAGVFSDAPLPSQEAPASPLALEEDNKDRIAAETRTAPDLAHVFWAGEGFRKHTKSKPKRL